MRSRMRANMGAMAFFVLSIAPLSYRAKAQDAVGAAAPAKAREVIPVWVFKPKQSPYVAPNQPVWHIADILARHKGQPDWAQPVIKDRWFFTQYISMGQGKKTPTSFQIDTIIWFVVQSGQIRFTIKGQEPFIATTDSIIQIPMRTPYSMETVGNEPSVRLEVRIADGATAYPVADNPTAPTPPAGYDAVKVNFTAPSSASSVSAKTVLDFDKDVVGSSNPPARGASFFVKDPQGFAVPIRSAATPIPPKDIGHFHTGVAEFWYVLEGDMDVRIEGVAGLVEAHHGDIVYAPTGRYHRTIMVGSPMSTRLAMGSVADSGASFTPYTGN